MGSTPHGINGPIKGKIGTVHGSSRNGKPYVKGPYKKRTKKISSKERSNRVRFAGIHLWLKPITAFVREGFKGFVYREGAEAYVSSISYLTTYALEGEKPNQTINPALVQVSYGHLPLAADMAVEEVSPYVLKFSWDKAYIPYEDTDQAVQSLKDQVMLLAYDVEHKEVKMNTMGQFRGTGEDFLYLNRYGIGYTYHIYMAFLAADRNSRSHSVYMGTITTK